MKYYIFLDSTPYTRYCHLSEGIHYLQPYGHGFAGPYWFHVVWSGSTVGTTLGVDGMNWNYVDEDVVSVDITVLTEDEVKILQMFDLQTLTLDTDMEFVMQGDDTVNPSSMFNKSTLSCIFNLIF